MWKLVFFIYPVAEIYLIYRFIETYTFLDFLAATFLFGACGLTVMMLIGRSTLESTQKSLANRELPKSFILHKAVMMLGGLLLFLPGVLNDVIGICLIMPGIRHFLVWYIKVKMAKGFISGSSKIFSAGFGTNGAGFRRSGFSFHTMSDQVTPEREATVVDIKPIKIEHHRTDE